MGENEAEGGDGLNQAGHDPGDDDGVLPVGYAAHPGEDEDVDDEDLDHDQHGGDGDGPPSAAVTHPSAVFIIDGGRPIGEEPHAHAGQEGGQGEGEEDGQCAQGHTDGGDQEGRGQTQVDGGTSLFPLMIVHFLAGAIVLAGAVLPVEMTASFLLAVSDLLARIGISDSLPPALPLGSPVFARPIVGICRILAPCSCQSRWAVQVSCILKRRCRTGGRVGMGSPVDVCMTSAGVMSKTARRTGEKESSRHVLTRAGVVWRNRPPPSCTPLSLT